MRHPSSEIRRPASRVAILFLAVGLVAATASCALLDKALPSPPKAAAAVAGLLPTPSGPSGPKPPSLPVSVDIYRTGKIDPRAKLPETAAVKAAFRDPFQDGLRLLTENLLKGESDPFLKAKLIHDWICASISYDAAMLRQGTVANQDIQSVLSSRKAVCSGYSRVFQAMADFAGIPCVTVSGYVKNQRGARGLGQDNSHAWNLVQIHGRWYIVDTTFDAGYVKEWVFVKKYSTENLFVDPARSIYARYPKEAWHQLLSSPLSGQDFLNLPDAETAFFDYGLEFDSQRIAWENPTLGLYSLELKGGKDEIVLDGALLGPDGRELPGATFLKRPGSGRYGISASMPQKGVYTLEVYAKRRGEARFDYLVESAKFEGKILPALDKADRTALAPHIRKNSSLGVLPLQGGSLRPGNQGNGDAPFDRRGLSAGLPPESIEPQVGEPKGFGNPDLSQGIRQVPGFSFRFPGISPLGHPQGRGGSDLRLSLQGKQGGRPDSRRRLLSHGEIRRRCLFPADEVVEAWPDKPWPIGQRDRLRHRLELAGASLRDFLSD